MPQPLRLGTRGSRLALVQAEMVRALLARAGADCVLVPVKTSGDRIQDRSLADAGGKGLFTKELEEALLRSEIDLAVHSMKDVPTALPPGLAIAALLPREDPRDAFVSLKAGTLAELPKGARVGTSSVRRAAQVLRARPDLQTALLRGNVDTRLAKLDAGEFDAMLLALAGLKRLDVAHRATALLDAEDWLPALAQGAIGIEVREADAETTVIVATLNDARTQIELACERAFQSALDGTCRTPIGGLARFVDGTLFFRGEVLAPDGSDFAGTKVEVALSGDDVLRKAAYIGRGAGLELRRDVEPWLAV